MKSHAQIIRDIGAGNVADRHGVSIHTVRSWVQRDSIPSLFWPAFASDGHCTVEDLAAYNVKRRQAA